MLMYDVWLLWSQENRKNRLSASYHREFSHQFVMAGASSGTRTGRVDSLGLAILVNKRFTLEKLLLSKSNHKPSPSYHKYQWISMNINEWVVFYHPYGSIWIHMGGSSIVFITSSMFQSFRSAPAWRFCCWCHRNVGFRGSSHLSWLPGRLPGLQFFEAWMGQLLPLQPGPLGRGRNHGETMELMKDFGAIWWCWP